MTPHSGYLQAVDVDDIAGNWRRRQRAAAAEIYLRPRRLRAAGGPARLKELLAQGTAGRGLPQRRLRHVRQFSACSRTIRFGLRQMVDRLRAYRPLRRDSRTAIQVVHHLSAVESVLASRARTTCAAAPGAHSSRLRLAPASPPTCVRMCPDPPPDSREPLVLTALRAAARAVTRTASTNRAV